MIQSSMSSSKNIAHLLFTAFPAWGHTRTFCILAARIVKENENLVITMILSPNLLTKAQAAVSAEFGKVSEEVRRRVRVLSSFKSDSEDLFNLSKPLVETYSEAYKMLSQGKPISCAVYRTTFDAVVCPRVVIVDLYAYPQKRATRAITGNAVPVISWITGHAAAFIRLYGPENHGGLGDIAIKIEDEAIRTGVTPQEIADTFYNRTDGKIIKIPGVPAMYDWEFFPQASAFKAPITELLKMAQAGLKDCDGVLTTSAYAFEKGSLDALTSWFSEWNKQLYIIGPLLPSKHEIAPDGAQGSLEIKEFLDKMLVNHGKNSVVLFSFGTVFWPNSSDYIEEVIEALIEKQFPFIIGNASPLSNLPDELLHKMKASGLGLTSKWLPQQYILDHAAVGWFLTHGGHNGVTESLGSGVPMICWPFAADQPPMAAHLSENLDVAFELIEIRTGAEGMKPLLRSNRKPKGTREAVGIEIRQVLDACRHVKGDNLRNNAQSIRREFAEAWGDNGISRKNFHAFLQNYGIN